ncbi:MAG: hypothetical protein ACI9QL_004107 [Candidatus Omnitrophota bacterium]
MRKLRWVLGVGGWLLALWLMVQIVTRDLALGRAGANPLPSLASIESIHLLDDASGAAIVLGEDAAKVLSVLCEDCRPDPKPLKYRIDGRLKILTKEGGETRVDVFFTREPVGALRVNGIYLRGGSSAQFRRLMTDEAFRVKPNSLP